MTKTNPNSAGARQHQNHLWLINKQRVHCCHHPTLLSQAHWTQTSWGPGASFKHSLPEILTRNPYALWTQESKSFRIITNSLVTSPFLCLIQSLLPRFVTFLCSPSSLPPTFPFILSKPIMQWISIPRGSCALFKMQQRPTGTIVTPSAQGIWEARVTNPKRWGWGTWSKLFVSVSSHGGENWVPEIREVQSDPSSGTVSVLRNTSHLKQLQWGCLRWLVGTLSNAQYCWVSSV